MKAEFWLAISLGLACFAIIWQAGTIMQLRRKNEAQRKLMETPAAPKPKRIKPSRIVVTTSDGKTEIVYGWRLQHPTDGRLIVTDDEDLIGAVFGPGKWISAVVREEEKAAKPEAKS
jgi:hypothetical protein